MRREEYDFPSIMLGSSHRPFNVKRKTSSSSSSMPTPLSRQSSRTGSTKLTMQDIVRMDPGYTPNIEHLVFPTRKRGVQQVNPVQKTRSRLAEMFALSRHLQQRSADRDRESKARLSIINRSVDSALEGRGSVNVNVGNILVAAPPPQRVGSVSGGDPRRWLQQRQQHHHQQAEEPVRRISSLAESGISAVPRSLNNVSVLHFRNNDDWQKDERQSTTSKLFQSRGKRNSGSLIKHQPKSFPKNYNRTTSLDTKFDRMNSDVFIGKNYFGSPGNAEMSSLRWYDQDDDDDSVFLGRSGWVQLQHRSLDEKKISNLRTTAKVQPNRDSKRVAVKLADYHCKSEPGKYPLSPTKLLQPQKHLQLRDSDSPPLPQTPIISPPIEFQDKNKSTSSSTSPPRVFFPAKPPFLKRSQAVDDTSPPLSPERQTFRTYAPMAPTSVPKDGNKVLQVKSMDENASSNATLRRFRFRHHESSSSSSASSMNFRSLDSCVAKPPLPRLSENTDSSVHSSVSVYEDADDEDNNSSSINTSVNLDVIRARGKVSQIRNPLRQSPDVKKQPNFSSSSTESIDIPGRNSTQSNIAARRSPLNRAINYHGPDENSKVRRSRSLQLAERKPTNANANEFRRISPQPTFEKNRQSALEVGYSPEDARREAEVVTEFVYGNRNRAAAQALLMHRINNNGVRETQNLTPFHQTNRNQEVPPRISPQQQQYSERNHRYTQQKDSQFFLRSSQSYHHVSLDSSKRPNRPHQDSIKKRHQPGIITDRRMLPIPNTRSKEHQIEAQLPSFNGRFNYTGVKYIPEPVQTKLSPSSPKNSSNRSLDNVSNSSSSSDLWLTSDRTVTKCPRMRSSGTSTPYDDELLLPDDDQATRPGSAPSQHKDEFLEVDQRSLSLPKSFHSIREQQQSKQLSKPTHGVESRGSSPKSGKNIASIETSHTAPVTPLHDINQRRSPLREAGAVEGSEKYCGKASSTPELLDSIETQSEWKNRHRSEDAELTGKCGEREKTYGRKLIRASTAESVFQKFKKSITSLRFQKKTSSSLDHGQIISGSTDLIEGNDHPTSSSGQISDSKEENEQKPRFGSLIWRSSKERKRMNKAARSAKCNSGDSGIQIEMVPGGCGGIGGGDSSESHDTDVPIEDFENSPPVVRRVRPAHQTRIHRPNSDLLNQILIDKFKADLRQRAHRHQRVRRTRSDLGGRRIYNWDQLGRSSYRRMMSSPSPIRNRPKSPQRKPPEAPELRPANHRRAHLRRSLSQPLDIDKLSPLMRTIAPAGFRLSGTNVAAMSEDERCSEDDNMSDSESSVASLGERKKSIETDEEMVILAEAVFDHVAIESEELAFRAGDVIEVLETTNRDWWWGSTNNKAGWFPAQFVRLRVSQEDTVEDCLAAMASGQSVPTHLRRRTSISLLSNDQVRTSVVKELVSTERDFVKVLRDIVEGFIGECRKRTDMFSEEQINTIFINLEDILKFQSSFLADLEACINWNQPHKSCVANCFLKYKQGFEIYSDYCNSHPMATVLLQELYLQNNYCKFFEACRLMRGLVEIPLDGYLLTPIQRICKYPLQLAELLKYTKTEHDDYKLIVEALEGMREVAVLINERKRRMESLEKLAAWQHRVEAWEGEDLIERSSQMIHQGEVVRVKSGVWTSNVTLFLFDHQLVYCKRDILKRNTYVYKGRIDLDTTEVIDVVDGKDIHIGVSVRHAVKLYSVIRDKWLLFCCRTSSEKEKWLKAFNEERRLVAQDKNEKMEFTSTAKQLAKMSARCKRRPPRKPRANKNFKYDSPYTGSMLQLNTGSSQYSLGRKVGTWFTFGGNKKNRRHHHPNPTIHVS